MTPIQEELEETDVSSSSRPKLLRPPELYRQRDQGLSAPGHHYL